MKIAVEGCCHGSLDATYSSIANLEKRNGYKVDVLLIGGDFQAIRNHADLNCMAVPQKFRQLGEFHKYYTGASVAPILTIVIGGNHEASNYLWELYHGGWLAHNIYYLGGSGCVNVNGVRIAGASGIYKPNHYRMGHFERVPYDSGSMRSVYHVRHYDVTKLSLLTPPDVFLSHDWPQGIEHHGDLQSLLTKKPFFKDDIAKGELGSPPMTQLMKTLRPKRWFSAHLHVKFEATFSHDGPGAAAVVESNPDEIAIDDDEFNDPAPEAAPAEPSLVPTQGALETKFLALDKCLPRRQYLEVVDIPTPEYDARIAAISIEPPTSPTAPTPTPSIQAEPDTAPLSESDSFRIPTPPPPTDPIVSTEEAEVEAELMEEMDAEPDLSAFGFTSFGKQKPQPKSKPTSQPSKPLPKHTGLPSKPAIAPSSSSTATDQNQNQNQNQNPVNRPKPELTYDLEWLAISRALHPYLSLQRSEIPLPNEATLREMVKKELEWIKANVLASESEGEGEGKGKSVNVIDVQKFVATAVGATGGGGRGGGNTNAPLMWYTNPQTEAFCRMIGVENKVNPVPKQ